MATSSSPPDSTSSSSKDITDITEYGVDQMSDTISTANTIDTTGTGETERSVWSPYSSLSSAATARPRHPQSSTLGSAFKWLGGKSMDTIHSAVITKRANAHITRVKEWQKRIRPRLGQEERDKVSEMLGDALEMARQCYPPRINKLSYSIGREVQQWLHFYPNLPQTTENSLLLIQVQICLIPIVLTRISDYDPLASDLAHDLINALTRTPFTLFTTLQDPEKAAVTIRLVARELAYGRCAAQHGWLGVDLLRIVEMVMGLRKLTEGEQVSIRELAARRRQQSDAAKTISRPWEIALFALCSSQNPWFKDVVLGPTGVQSLVTALDTMLAPSTPFQDVHWENVALTLRALAFLSEHDWVARAVEERIVRSLLGVFRRSIPERWFCIRFWAMDTIRNILSHRPPLVSTLIRENAAVAFATLTAPSSPTRSRSSRTSPASPSTSPTSTTCPNLSSSPSTGTSLGGKTKGRLMEDYKREASKRAEELTSYIKDWKAWKPYPTGLEPVSITSVTASF
ncbi:hypothetical protein JB92DRAFT_2893550 [Gautieria morchelliformis]|nr:hypothetical protein JB92DRAFT_2893550 [Gautieria morchelliformis]